ncbi:MAG: hypothetical protein HQK83_17915 [Fibrobacteria bacterium]|nr:hypothetical protein [Fibrobacteria bacterium]
MQTNVFEIQLNCKAGFVSGDVILRVNKTRIDNPSEFKKVIKKAESKAVYRT